MTIHESGENYLEAILKITQERGAVRSIDVANDLGFSKPSISVAMKNFREQGYITVDREGYITLTDIGREVAERVYERHRFLTRALIALGVDDAVAEQDACKLEHDLSQESFDAIKGMFERLEKGTKT